MNVNVVKENGEALLNSPMNMKITYEITIVQSDPLL